MARENFDVNVPDGTHLGLSRDSDGAYRAHLFSDDTNKLVGHAELFEPVHDGDSSTGSTSVFVYVQDDRADAAAVAREAQQRAETAKLVADLIVIGVIRVAPHVKAWWVDRAAPAAREVRDKLGRGREDRRAARAALSAAAEETRAFGDEVADTRPDLGASTKANRPVMSSDEAWDRFNAAIRARQFSDEQLAMLREARIEDGSDLQNLESLAATGSPRHVGARATSMIEVGPALLDEGTLAQVRALLEEDQPDKVSE